MHVVLLGDSIFDNGLYVPGKPDDIRRLRRRFPQGGKASLCAVDGHVIADVASQLQCIPPDASHLVVSAGGNDALGYSHILENRVATVAERLWRSPSLRPLWPRLRDDDQCAYALRFAGGMLHDLRADV